MVLDLLMVARLFQISQAINIPITTTSRVLKLFSSMLHPLSDPLITLAIMLTLSIHTRHSMEDYPVS
jgi:hypothetical protein